MPDIASGGFRKASGPFWCARSPGVKDGKFARGNPLVLVYDPGKGDFRLKTWLQGRRASATIDGYAVVFNLRTNPDGLHEAAFSTGDTVWRLIRGLAPESGGKAGDGPDEGPDEFLDVCFEAPFAPDPAKGENYWWPAPVDGLPGWLNASSIRIAPANHQGGQYIEMQTGLSGDAQRQPYAFRVNGVWCRALPDIRKWTDAGMPVYTGFFTLHALPEDMAEARERSRPVEPDEPMRPVTRKQVKDLYRQTGSRNAAAFSKWMEDVRYLTQTWWRVAQCHGQLQVHSDSLARNADAAARYTRLLEKEYESRKPAYRGYDLESWAKEQAPRKYGGPLEWLEKRRLAEEARAHCKSSCDRFLARLAEVEDKVSAADARCREREEEYADAIRYMMPAR